LSKIDEDSDDEFLVKSILLCTCGVIESDNPELNMYSAPIPKNPPSPQVYPWVG